MDQPAPPAPAAASLETHARRLVSFPWRGRRPPTLLPAAAAAPLTFLAVWLLPQALLLVLNLQAWDLASSEMSPAERGSALFIFGLELALFLGGGAFFAERLLRRRPLSRLAGFCFVLAASVYLGVVIGKGEDAIPAALRPWMLPPDQWIYKQFALVGVGAIYGALRLLCPDREDDFGGGLLLSVLAFASPFGFLLLALGGGISTSLFGLDSRDLFLVFLPLYLTASTLAVGAVLRVSASAYVACRRSHPAALFALTLLVAFALPLAGLALNGAIPFPADFQIPSIYALAAINGLVLALPNFSHPAAHRATWLAQCALFPFSAYFFAVFLPTLPLMPLAAICLGAGVLMVVPSALFLLHGYRLLDGLRAERRDGPRWRPVVLALAAIGLGPALLTAKILHERAALRQALDDLEYPDYAAGHPFPGNRASLRASLLALRDFQAGHYLPLYSEFYNWLAFDNLLLPQARLEETYRAFFGEPLPAPNAREMEAPFFRRNRPRNAQEVLRDAGNVERPRADATLQALETTVTATPGETRALARMVVRNATAAPAEYRATIHVPAGVAITGLWLTIGSDRVPARLFEERAALWVYQQITDVRRPRDPAILRYTGPETAELRVFPVDSHATRTVEIEFAAADNFSPAIAIDGRPLELPAARSAAVALAPGAAWVPAAAVAGIPPLRRRPEPHVVVDTSLHSRFRDPAALRDAIRRALDAFPAATSARVTFANFNRRDYRNGAALSVGALRDLGPKTLGQEAGPIEGGFLEARAIKEILVRQSQRPAGESAATFPAIVVLRGSGDAAVKSGDAALPEFARLLPDQPATWVLEPGALAPTLRPLAGDAAATPLPVRLYERAGRRFAAPADGPAFLLADTPFATGPVTVYDPRRRAFVPLAPAAAAPAPLAGAAAAWALANQRLLDPAAAGPASLGKLLARARQAGTLVPSTALMVVETTAQWKMLALTEKKTLKGHEALALAEPAATPEPGTVALLVIAALGALAWKKLPKFRKA